MLPVIQNIAVIGIGGAGLLPALAPVPPAGFFDAKAQPIRKVRTQLLWKSHLSFNDAFAERTALRLPTTP